MENGLKVIVLPGAYYGYAVTKVGWIRRVAGDEWEVLPGAVILYRTGEQRTFEHLAAKGPGKDYKVYGEPAEAAEHIHRLLVRRIFPADESAWRKVCPRPQGWSDKQP